MCRRRPHGLKCSKEISQVMPKVTHPRRAARCSRSPQGWLRPITASAHFHLCCISPRFSHRISLALRQQEHTGKHPCLPLCLCRQRCPCGQTLLYVMLNHVQTPCDDVGPKIRKRMQEHGSTLLQGVKMSMDLPSLRGHGVQGSEATAETRCAARPWREGWEP